MRNGACASGVIRAYRRVGRSRRDGEERWWGEVVEDAVYPERWWRVSANHARPTERHYAMVVDIVHACSDA